ncbi:MULTISPECIES: glycine oxidase ThiO [unclassified Staphylococcus]|uniref:glycine oxidase ThiO n=1 Tax=unclassified Staphylococcus TaxID=91994 RepID=UPI0021D16483|nr:MULTISPECIES: glycine oxidase ThiO [unclassified Staphylococcus]UXR71611.1 glycine oxidase ThiO [Staphylococcus sp. IVB6240]UXR76208.1 glycine oxidase ThiO [Staphylococcus sp. IVB6233]UXR80405.1 glycine oxidase ThiO [Staphylococcus sp. IVB6218]
MLQTVIIGAGVMGLSIARQLNPQNRHIHIIDRSTPRMNASYAAGGMLGAQNEFFEDTPLYHLAMESRAMMPATAQQLLKETNMDIELQSHGLIKVATTPQDIPAVEKQFAFLAQQDHEIYQLTPEQLRQRFPYCDTASCAAFKIHDDGQINANLYTQALLQSVSKRAHIDLHLHTEVLHITQQASHYQITTSKGTFNADELIIAAGAWSGELLHQLDIHLPTHPVKGDVKLIASSYKGLKETIFNMNGCYIVPKKPNRYLIGATSERDNWSTQNKEENLQWLDRESQLMIPQLREHHVIKTWTGIRPITSNEVPIMGALRDNLYISTGHYRNGILLSPIVGERMAQLIDGDARAATQLRPFSPIK